MKTKDNTSYRTKQGAILLATVIASLVIGPSGAASLRGEGGKQNVDNTRFPAVGISRMSGRFALESLALPADVNQLDATSAIALIDPVTGFILTNLAKGALSHIGGKATGWILGKVGLTSGTDQSLDEIKAELREQSKMLASLQRGLDELKRQLEAAVKLIMGAIVDEHERTRFELRVSNLNQNVATLLAFSDALHGFSEEEPSELQRERIVAFRDNVLNPANVLSAIRAIDGEMRGTPSSEGLIPLWSRIEMKTDSDIHQLAQSFSDMFEYYYSYQILGLQLVFEAYHSYDPPQFGAIKSYYDIWTGFVSEQTTEYMSRAPIAKKANEFEMDPAGISVVGIFEHMTVSEDRVYVLNNTGFLHSTKLDGTDLRTVDAGLDNLLSRGLNYPIIPVLKVFGDSVMVGGPSAQQPEFIKISKFDKKALMPEGEVVLASSRGTVAVSRGFDINKEDETLYVVQLEVGPNRLNTTLQAVDITSMNYQPDKSVLVNSFDGPRDHPSAEMAFVEDNMAVVVLNWKEIGLFDVKEKKELNRFSGPSGAFQTDNGLTVTYEFFHGMVRLETKDSISGRTTAKALKSIMGGDYATSAGATGLTIYSSSKNMYSNFTLFDPKQTLTTPLDETGFVGGMHAVHVSGENVYAAGFPNGKVAVYNVSFPIGHPPALTIPE